MSRQDMLMKTIAAQGKEIDDERALRGRLSLQVDRLRTDRAILLEAMAAVLAQPETPAGARAMAGLAGEAVDRVASRRAAEPKGARDVDDVGPVGV